MLCKNPYVQGILPYGCGQCLPCRINRRRLWTSRLLLEQAKHSDSSFVTLTYSEKKLPKGATLVPKHTQDWLKKLRRKTDGGIRFYLVGEYGDASERPHYHVALFGYPACAWYPNEDAESIRQRNKCVCIPCSTIRSTWGNGLTDCGSLTKDSAQYVAGYVTKKMTSKDDIRLSGRHPEFARMSNRPGIGALAVAEISEVLQSQFGVNSLVNNRDVPVSLNLGKSGLPLGRYLRSKIREKIASEKGRKIIKSENSIKHALEMRSLLESSRSDSVSQGFKSAREIILENAKQEILNCESRYRVFSKKGSI